MSVPWSRSFREVLGEELKKVGDQVGTDTDDPIARAHAKQLVGLAFSGGGIRSATFNLGVLQSLARMGLLSRFDYLSTVSGGGYIGSWLIAWMSRRGVTDVHAGLLPEWKRQPGRSEVPEIRFLRQFSNYLTPKLGWLGADMWTVIAIYVRNLILNLLILGAAFAIFLLLPRLIGVALRNTWNPESFRIVAAVGLATVFAAVMAIVRSMRYFPRRGSAERKKEILSELERSVGWKDAEGRPVELPVPDARAAWYGKELFDDFVLKVEFKITQKGDGKVFVWTPWNEEAGIGKPEPDGGVKIHVCSDGKTAVCIGTIDEQQAVRQVAISDEWNTLEITCARDRCTVRVNEETTNTKRVTRRTVPGRWSLRSPRPLPGAIGIEKGGILFRNIEVEKIEGPAQAGATQGQVQRFIIVPLFVAAFLGTFLFGFGDHLPREAPAGGVRPMREWIGAPPLNGVWTALDCALLAGAVSAVFVLSARVLWALWRKQPVLAEVVRVLPAIAGMFVAAGCGGVMARGLYYVFRGKTVWEVLTWGTPALLGVFFITIILLIGLLGRFLPDERREWWSRLSAWLSIYALAWIATFGIAFYGPALLQQAGKWAHLLSGAWIVATISGLIAARSVTTGKEKSNTLWEVLAKVSPYIFVLGFFILLSWGIEQLIRLGSTMPPLAGNNFAELLASHWAALYETSPEWLLWVTLGALAIAGVLSLRLDINQFSMHLLYRNRLGRCYLGASTPLRRAQPFTGFSPDDDLFLRELSDLFEPPRVDSETHPCPPAPPAPYPIINAALNLVGGKELAWQQRKAASFVFTPLYCGYEFPELPPGYCKTDEFANKPSPVSLATAMAISGAAASPNMGYHTAPAPAFLMTVFNVRLGWWLGNPRREHGYTKSGPLNVLWSLVCELFGLTSEEGKYIYLSDGGHFENLGIYELVRRRCRYILACDAEEDGAFSFSGLGNAIEKCRSDFGVDIDIDLEPIRRRSEAGHSGWHCAIGTIYYSRVDKTARDGTLVYLKASLTGDEPTDVLRYAAANAAFPHQSTSDQWFDESQFESYRVLGFHIAENVFKPVGNPAKLCQMTKEELFVRLAQQWYPPSAATADAFTKHTRTTVAIYDELRNNRDLAFMSEWIYPEWRVLFEKTRFRERRLPHVLEGKKSLSEQLPTSEAQLRAGFYICNSVLQLFEDAYVDLQLEDEFDHPDNRGWMNFFRHWSWVPMLRATWTICASNYGARFQSFCERHLDLTIGMTIVPVPVALGKERLIDSEGTIAWDDAVDPLADEIANAIWIWVKGLPMGSEIVSRAALRVSILAPGSDRDPGNSEEDAMLDAQQLVCRELSARAKQPIANKSAGERDEEWHAAARLLEMCRRKDVKHEVKVQEAKTIAQRSRLYGALIAARLSSASFKEVLNPPERELIRHFFAFNPALASSAKIWRLEMTPETKPNSKDSHLRFPFAFAITATVPCEDKAKSEDRPNTLVYFRVQDHVRRMGLARRALELTIEEGQVSGIEPKRMHPEAQEVPSEKDQTRFLRIFRSAESAAEQQKAKGRRRSAPAFE